MFSSPMTGMSEAEACGGSTPPFLPEESYQFSCSNVRYYRAENRYKEINIKVNIICFFWKSMAIEVLCYF